MTGRDPRAMETSHIHAPDFITALIAALVASFHCVGMCGGFAVGASAGQRLLPSQALYHTGKTVPYLAIGAVVGLLGENLARGGSSRAALQWLALLAGLLLIAVGLHALGWLPGRRGVIVPGPGRATGILAALGRVARAAASYRGPARPLVLGTLSGLLPCPLVYAFAARAASTGSVVGGMTVMAALGLGTVPALAAVGASGKLVTPLLRHRMVRLSGLLMIALGLYTWWRGFSLPPCCGVAVDV